MTELILRLSVHDERVLHALVVRRRPWLDAVLTGLTHLGGAAVSIGCVLVLLVVGGPVVDAAAALAGFALALSHTLVQVVKRSVVRPRPKLPVGLESLVHTPDRFSFPSGHSAASLAVAVPLSLLLGGLAGAGLLLLAIVIGFSRCYLGVHYPGDILAGWALALVGLGAGMLIGL